MGTRVRRRAWGFLQGLEYISETFDWPQQVRQIALLALVIGLPIVLVLAWYHGDRGEQRVRGAEIAIITLLFLVGGGVFWRYERASEAPTSAECGSTAVTAALPQLAALPDQKSIAVLPFVDMSAEEGQEYIRDGMAEELLNLLAKVPELHVIARTSSFSFKGKKIDIAEIAKKAKRRTRTRGQRPQSGRQVAHHGAAHPCQRQHSPVVGNLRSRLLDDVFKVQDDIANAVVQALQIKLAGGELSRRKGGTQNLEAYQLYLRAMSSQDQNNKSSLDAAERILGPSDQTRPELWHGVVVAGVKHFVEDV